MVYYHTVSLPSSLPCSQLIFLLSSSHLLASFLSFVSSHPFPSFLLLHSSFFSPIPSQLYLFPQAAEECGSLEINSATDTGSALSQDMTGAKKEVREGQLFSLSGEPMESCAEVSGATSVGSSMAHLSTTFNQGMQYGANSSIISIFYKSH